MTLARLSRVEIVDEILAQAKANCGREAMLWGAGDDAPQNMPAEAVWVSDVTWVPEFEVAMGEDNAAIYDDAFVVTLQFRVRTTPTSPPTQRGVVQDAMNAVMEVLRKPSNLRNALDVSVTLVPGAVAGEGPVSGLDNATKGWAAAGEMSIGLFYRVQ